MTKQTLDLSNRFWETKSLAELNSAEWEALCDGCGLCCLTKLQDDGTDEIVYTRVVCPYSDLETGACSDYENRSVNVPSCVTLTLQRVAEFDWLPDSCAYRMRYRGQSLPEWHHLNSGSRTKVHQQGIGLLGIPVVVDTPDLNYEDYLMDTP